MTTPQEYYAKAEAALAVASAIQGEHLDDEISAHDMVQYVRAMESARLLLAFAGTGAEIMRLPPSEDEITKRAMNRADAWARGW